MQRKLYIDILKGLAIFLVVLAHVINPVSFLSKFIFSFHMPLFFIISGYLFNFEKYERNIFLFIKTKFQRLIIPCYVSVLLFLLFWLIYQCPKPFIDTPALNIFSIFKNDLSGALYGIGAVNKCKTLAGIVPIGPIWFCLCLFCSEILFFIFSKILNNRHFLLQLIIYFCLSYIGIMIGKYVFLPWSFDIALTALFFVFIGFSLNKYNILEKLSSNKYIVVSLIILLMTDYFTFNNSFLSMNNRYYKNFVYSYIAAISFSLVLFIICKKLSSMQFLIIKKLTNIFCLLGEETLIILIMHNRIIFNTPNFSLLQYNDIVYTVYIILFSLMIGAILRKIPVMKYFYYPLKK